MNTVMLIATIVSLALVVWFFFFYEVDR